MKHTELEFNKRYRCSCKTPAEGYFSFISENDLPVFVRHRVDAVDLHYFESTCKDGWQEVK